MLMVNLEKPYRGLNEGVTMAFAYENERGNTYYLHGRETTLRNGAKRTIYFFAKEEKEGALNQVPDGYEVMETANGLPVLKKSS